MAIAKALAELEGRRLQVQALTEALKAKSEEADALRGALDATEKALAKWKEAAEARAEANTTDAKLEASYEASLKLLTDEIERVRAERDTARKRNVIIGVLCFAGGVLLTLVATRNQ